MSRCKDPAPRPNSAHLWGPPTSRTPMGLAEGFWGPFNISLAQTCFLSPCSTTLMPRLSFRNILHGNLSESAFWGTLSEILSLNQNLAQGLLLRWLTHTLFLRESTLDLSTRQTIIVSSVCQLIIKSLQEWEMLLSTKAC